MRETTDLFARRALGTLGTLGALRALRTLAAAAGSFAAAARSLAAAAAAAAAAAKTPQLALDGVDVTKDLLAPLGVGRQDAKSSIVSVDRAGGEKEAKNRDGKFLVSNEHGGESLVRGKEEVGGKL